MPISLRTKLLIFLACFVVLGSGMNMSAHAASAYPATGVLGQYNSDGVTPNFTINGVNNQTSTIVLTNAQTTLPDPANSRIFIADSNRNRILIIPYDPTTGVITLYATPQVFGQTNLSSSTFGTTSSTLSFPGGLAYDSANQRLFVADSNNNRILVWNVATSTLTNGEGATNVLGQSDFLSGGSGTTSSTLSFPGGLAYDSANQRLFVADGNNNRVMVWSVATSTLTNGKGATNVLGQSDFVSSGFGTTSSTLGFPVGLAYDSSNRRLFVVDDSNNRVLIFNVATSTITNGEGATNVLGQSDFVRFGGGITASTFRGPLGTAYDSSNQRLFVADDSNNRVLIFNVATSTIANGENATNVLGQKDFTSNNARNLSFPVDVSYDSVSQRLYVAEGGNHNLAVVNVAPAVLVNNKTPYPFVAPGANGLELDNLAGYVTLDSINHRLFVVDNQNNRVLVFLLSQANAVASSSANYGLGQPDFISNATGLTSSTPNYPEGVAYDSSNQRLFVADDSNNRVLIFNVATSTIANGEGAIHVLGQSEFLTSSAFTDQTGLNGPNSLAYDSANQRLFVADGNNNRVMVWSVATSSITDGESAVNVLGQSLFTRGSGDVGQGRLNGASDIAFDSVSQRLFVADNNNNRVMVWNVATSTITNGELAQFVLGQSDFSGNGSGVSTSTFSTPDGITYDSSNQRLFVADSNNNRVMIFNVATSTITNGENATNVLGQSDFVSKGTGITSSTLNVPIGLAYDSSNQRLFAVDGNNNRVLIYNFVQITTTSTLTDTTLGSAYNQAFNTTSSEGTVTFALTGGSLPPGFTLGTSTLTGTSTTAGAYSFTLQASDVLAPNTFANSRTFTLNVVAPPAPTSITGANPQTTLGGYAITINGTGFQSGATVKVSSTAATSVAFVSSTSLTALAPALASGTYNVVVTNPDARSGTCTNCMTYENIPTIASVSPTSGLNGNGGDTITVTGTRLKVGTNGASIDGTQLTTAGVSTSTTFITPAHGAGAASLRMYATEGTDANGIFADSSTSLTYLAVPSSGGGRSNSGGGGGGGGGGTGYIAPASPPPSSATSTIGSLSSSQGSSIAELQAQLVFLQAELQTLLAQAATSGVVVTLPTLTFTRNLQFGMRGSDVHQLQLFLISANKGNAARALATHGTTQNFGILTKNALIEYQKAVHIVPASGYFGPITRQYVNAQSK